jgi:hypothetical protein
MKEAISTISKKKLRSVFDLTLSDIDKSIELVYLMAFHLKVKPLADRYNWTVDWGMGSVTFETWRGEVYYEDENRAIKKLIRELEDMFGNVLPRGNCGILWDVMSSLGEYHRYNKILGLK